MNSSSNFAQQSSYIGRFAPSPSGPLHFGSLLTALASFLDARHHQGKWLVRMEDIDPPREEKGAKQRILNSLEAHGLLWDGEVMYQSQRMDVYEEVLLSLKNSTYPCTCSRQRLLELRGAYDSHCLHNPVSSTSHALTSIRLNLNTLSQDKQILAEYYEDIFQGKQQQSLHEEVGDFILRRKDGLVAYQLAVVVDDIEQNITHIIRGSDLLSSTPRQRYLIQLLQGAFPIYGHIPVATNHMGQKLSKQHKAKGLDDCNAFNNLCRALTFLSHPPPIDLIDNRDINELLHWATMHWERENIPSAMSFVVDDES